MLDIYNYIYIISLILFFFLRVCEILNRANYNMSLKDKELQLYFGTQSFMRVFIKNLYEITFKIMQGVRSSFWCQSLVSNLVSKNLHLDIISAFSSISLKFKITVFSFKHRLHLFSLAFYGEHFLMILHLIIGIPFFFLVSKTLLTLVYPFCFTYAI